MAVTLTLSTANMPNQPRVDLTGTVTRVQEYKSTATLSAADAFVFTSIPIPHGAKIISFKVGAVQETTSTTSVSIVFSAGLFYNGSVDYRAIWVNTGNFSQAAWKTIDYCVDSTISAGGTKPWPLAVSVSDDRAERYVYPMINVVSATHGSATGSLTVRMSIAVSYIFDL
jgi:hypothetical protein